MGSTENFWEIIYRRQINKMIGVCYRYVRDRQIAEDLAHEGFMIAINNHESFQGKGSIEAWLRRIIVNNTLRYLRDKKKEKSFEDWLNEKNTQRESIYDNTKENLISQANFSLEELFDAINSLPEHHKLVFNLFVLDKYTHVQIANELGITSGTSKSHLSRARKKLRKILYQKAIQDSDNKKRSKAFLLLVFPINGRIVDSIFQRAFEDFNIQYQSSDFIKSVNSIKNHKPIVKSIYKPTIINTKFLLILSISIGLVIVSFILFNIKPVKTQNDLEKKPIEQNSTLQTATLSKDSVILQKNIKKDTSMKKIEQLSLAILAASSLAIDSVGQTNHENINGRDEYLVSTDFDSINNNSDAYLQEKDVDENNEVIFDTEVHPNKKNLFIYQRKKYPLDFCNIANESFADTSKWEIDLTCCDYNNFYKSNEDNAINTLVYFSLKSKGDVKLSKGSYKFENDNINSAENMTFRGSLKIGSNKLEISGGDINVDYFEEKIIVKFNLEVETGKRISGNYHGIYKTNLLNRN